MLCQAVTILGNRRGGIPSGRSAVIEAVNLMFLCAHLCFFLRRSGLGLLLSGVAFMYPGISALRTKFIVVVRAAVTVVTGGEAGRAPVAFVVGVPRVSHLTTLTFNVVGLNTTSIIPMPTHIMTSNDLSMKAK